MSDRKIVILGLGMQGRAALYDVFHNTDAGHILVADNRPDVDDVVDEYSGGRVESLRFDAANESDLAAAMRGADVVVEALPGVMAISAGKATAEMGVNIVSSMYYINPSEQDPRKVRAMEAEVDRLDKESKKRGITILTEFGLDPGIDLVLGARALSELDEVMEFHSYGAGLPELEVADNPLKYKFSWSAIGVMRAYLRPAWVIRRGRIVEVGARDMFAPENMHILEVDEIDSPLECYPNGNSVHYAKVFGLEGSVREMGRYGFRYPGHCAFWEKIARSGFLEEKPIAVGKTIVSPVAFTAALLESQDQFQYSDAERDITLVRVDVRGKKSGKRKRIVYQLIDRRDLGTGFTAMQRTVGFMMGLGARFILDGRLPSGVLSPMDVPYDWVVQGLESFGMKVTRKELAWDEA